MQNEDIIISHSIIFSVQNCTFLSSRSAALRYFGLLLNDFDAIYLRFVWIEFKFKTESRAGHYFIVTNNAQSI